MNQFVSKPIQPQRAASLNRFREKRKERCFDKKIRYNVRKEVAMRYFILFTSYAYDFQSKEKGIENAYGPLYQAIISKGMLLYCCKTIVYICMCVYVLLT